MKTSTAQVCAVAPLMTSAKVFSDIVEKKRDRMQRAAEQDVRRGYDPSVSLSEFRRRLDRRSDIWDAQREHRYSN